MPNAVRLGLGALLLASLASAEVVAQSGRSREPTSARQQTDRVTPGDTPFAIAWRNGVTWEEIAAANRIDPDAPLRLGTVLNIPRPGAAPTRRREEPKARFAWPLTGEIRRAFRATSPGGHDGLDLIAEAGTPVRAAAAGRVIFAGEEPRQFGNLVVIDHGDGWHSAYGFLSRIAVREGQKVRAGARIGWVGNTGLAKGEELHFELRRDNRPVDPLPLLGSPR